MAQFFLVLGACVLSFEGGRQFAHWCDRQRVARRYSEMSELLRELTEKKQSGPKGRW